MCFLGPREAPTQTHPQKSDPHAVWGALFRIRGNVWTRRWSMLTDFHSNNTRIIVILLKYHEK